MIHLDLHLPDGTLVGHLLDRDAVPRRGDHVAVDQDTTLPVARVVWDIVPVGPEALASHTHVAIHLQEPDCA